MSTKRFNAGERVAYTGAWIKTVGAPKEIADMVGTVEKTETIGKREYVRVLWDGGNESKLVIPAYVCAVKSTQHINSDLPLT